MRNFIHFRKKWQNLSSYLCFIFLFYIPIYFPIPGKIQGTSFRDFKRKFLPRKLLLLKVQYENKGVFLWHTVIYYFLITPTKCDLLCQKEKTFWKKNNKELLKNVCLNRLNPSMP